MRNHKSFLGYGLIVVGVIMAAFIPINAKADSLTPAEQVQVCTLAGQLAGVAAINRERFPSVAANIEQGNAYVDENINEKYVPLAKSAIKYGAEHKGTPAQARDEFIAQCVQPKT